ncbi:MAG: 6-bladed beta-propeller [Candidatus Pseudobacter hemicellulosilyticus]|uniref:6-bladed beta-propeller n=1 Tax=Candidatus Pseudobacter hemicellulosilyticus TaxID=3121375 RepID=A0AAJ5WYU2_9BACT|nr:MAG: 6-bladed beta-propeller [Pseudobacter sp.]
MVVIRIDPGNAKGATVSAVFEEVNFIPLETKKESMFGNIAKLRMIGTNFVIFDWDTKSILIFSNNGKYINKIEAGNGDSRPGELYQFEVQHENGRGLILIRDNRFVFFYDEKGTLLKKMPSYAYSKYTQLKPHYTLKTSWMDKDSALYEYAFFKDDSLFSKYFLLRPAKGRSDIFNTGNGVSQQELETNYFLTRTYSYDIYKITLPNICLVYRLIFPNANSLPADFASNPAYIGRENRFNYFRTNKAVVLSLSNIHLFGDNLFVKLGIDRSTVGGTNVLVYNLKNREAISLNHIEPDTMSWFLPINDAGQGPDFGFYGFHFYAGGYLYTSNSSLVMFGSKNENAGKNISYNEALTHYFKTESARSNPVIVQLKPRNN